jgi:hypothetical protein
VQEEQLHDPDVSLGVVDDLHDAVPGWPEEKVAQNLHQDRRRLAHPPSVLHLAQSTEVAEEHGQGRLVLLGQLAHQLVQTNRALLITFNFYGINF